MLVGLVVVSRWRVVAVNFRQYHFFTDSTAFVGGWLPRSPVPLGIQFREVPRATGVADYFFMPMVDRGRPRFPQFVVVVPWWTAGVAWSVVAGAVWWMTRKKVERVGFPVGAGGDTPGVKGGTEAKQASSAACPPRPPTQDSH